MERSSYQQLQKIITKIIENLIQTEKYQIIIQVNRFEKYK